MVRMIMNGCNGRMGQMITGIVAEDKDIEIVAGIDLYDGISNTYPVFKSLSECNIEADVLIDFANASGVDAMIDWCVDNQVPYCTCTTGLSDETVAHIKDSSSRVAVVKSANMSLGINLLMKILRDNAAVLTEAGFDVEIVEKHHKMKLDSPSGTALSLADSVCEGTHKYDYIYDRSDRRQVRDANEIGFSAVRGGTIVGEHDVIFAGQDEVVTFSHTAYSRAVFAKGAVQAAKFLSGKPAGFYTMADVIG